MTIYYKFMWKIGTINQQIYVMCVPRRYTITILLKSTYDNTTRPVDQMKCPQDDCNSWLKDEYNLKLHLRRYHDSRQYECPECGRLCKNRHALSGHIYSTHSKKVFTCWRNIWLAVIRENHCTIVHSVLEHLIRKLICTHIKRKYIQLNGILRISPNCCQEHPHDMPNLTVFGHWFVFH